MRKLSFPIVSTLFDSSGELLALSKSEEGINLLKVNPETSNIKEINRFSGQHGILLSEWKGYLLISIDNRLLVSKDKISWNVGLELERSKNFIWHTAISENSIYSQEYGERTGIYESSDAEKWNLKARNDWIDQDSRHFHSITYDKYRNQLIATLGDGCWKRAVAMTDESGYQSLYRGPWQFLPIVVMKERIIFGMDSGIVNGGIGVYHPKNRDWTFVFLKWCAGNSEKIQMNELAHLSNGLWIASLGLPQAFVVSEDLRKWFPVHIEGFKKRFDHRMTLNLGEEYIALSTGKKLLLVERDKLASFCDGSPVVREYRPCMDKIKGYGFTCKKTLQKLSKSFYR